MNKWVQPGYSEIYQVYINFSPEEIRHSHHTSTAVLYFVNKKVITSPSQVFD